MWQLVFMINGYFITILGGTMLMVAAFDMYINTASWSYFMNSALFTLFVGIMLFLSNRAPVKNITMRQGFLLTTTSWLSMSFFGAVPFILYKTTNSFHDAFFETMSGLSATGATVFSDIEALPAAILLWRSLLTAIGGIGIIIFAVALLPFLGIGGMQIFQRENSDIGDKLMPKFHYIAKRILFTYILFGVICAVSYHWAGMGWFDAANHSMSTIATSGFSTKNASIAFYDSFKIEMVAVVFMLLCSLPMTFYIMLIQNKFRHSLRTEQVIAFLKFAAFYVLGTTFWLMYKGVYPDFVTSFRYASFNVVSMMSTTGFASTDFLAWGSLAVIIFIIFSLTGGCTGSTTGAIKIFRWQVLWAYLRHSLVQAVDPNRVVLIKIKQYVLESPVIASVLVFISLFFLTIAALTLLLCISGIDFLLALSAVIACITNTGPGVVAAIGPVGNYGGFSNFAKDVLSLSMLLGRLEILTVLVVFTKNFWRK